MTEELPEAKLKAVGQALVAKFGAFKSIDERREGQMEGRQAVELFLSFEKEKNHSTRGLRQRRKGGGSGFPANCLGGPATEQRGD